MEFTSTQHNHGVAPELHVWGWDVSLYLLFSGMAAGVLILVAAMFLWGGGEKALSKMLRFSVVAASILVPVAMLGLLSDLANKANILAFYKWWNFTSTMAVGARALLIIPPLGLLFGLVLVREHLSGRFAPLKPWAEKLVPYEKVLAQFTLASGLFLGTYTGVLLSANFGRPLWNTPLLPLVFLISGLSTGAAALILFSKDEHERTLLTKLDIGLIVGEMCLLLLMLLGFALTTRAGHTTLELVWGGPFTASFWVLIFGVGLIAPLWLEHQTLKGKVADTVIPSVLVLVGGLALRVIIVYAGQAGSIPN